MLARMEAVRSAVEKLTREELREILIAASEVQESDPDWSVSTFRQVIEQHEDNDN